MSFKLSSGGVSISNHIRNLITVQVKLGAIACKDIRTKWTEMTKETRFSTHELFITSMTSKYVECFDYLFCSCFSRANMMSGDSFYCAYLTLSSAHQQLQLWTPTKNTSKHKLPQLPAVSVYLQLSEMVVRAEGRWALVTQAGGVRVLEEELECCTQSWFSTTFYKQLSLMVRLHHSTIDSSFICALS